MVCASINRQTSSRASLTPVFSPLKKPAGWRSADACCPEHTHQGKMLNVITVQSLKETISDDEQEKE
ncbi:hypothetical protein EYZ11_010046 [Aspergillus tanneri]|uniref:Uncharacterized protein n=1 Tax=Aspergillus tanneri TaxID=1220188 RepID=A0A4S3J6E3_9EURO|nr:uncharacterized protein ATNIH1004_005550 [Aspergillus tanneri]KAA8646875.1 hypothetical protein ATNIH1004_005550 [Aspergillus tanneri]THC90500.1 hypothetical protein EYZ11_010046 [Aspergillus tanneri]